MDESAQNLPSKSHSLSHWLCLGVALLCVWVSWWTYRFATSHLPVRDLSIYLEAGRKVLQGADPYQPASIGSGFIYTPVALLLFAPLSRLPDTAVWGTWTVLNVLAYVGALLLTWRALQPRGVSRWLQAVWVLWAVSFAPCIEMLYAGQVNGLILLGIALFFYATVTNRWVAAGIMGIAGAAAIKMSPIVLLGLPAVWKSLRRVIWGLVAVLILAALAALVFGPEVWRQFLNVVPMLSRSHPIPVNQTLAVSVCAILRHGPCPALEDWTTFSSISILVLTFAAAFSGAPMLRERVISSALVVTGVVLASPLIWYHHMVFLTIPILALILGPHYGLPRWTPPVGWGALLLIQLDRWMEAKISNGLPVGSILGYTAIFAALLMLRLRGGDISIRAKPRHFPHTAVLSVLLTVFVILAVGYSIVIPPGEGVDETPHFDYVRYVKEYKALPIQPRSLEKGVQVWMGHHPPLYYILGGLATSWADTSDFAQAFRRNPHFIWMENVGSNGWNVMLHFGQERFPWRGSVLALHVLRFMTIGLGAVALWAIYCAVRLLFPERPWAPLGATALIGFNPSFVFMSSTVHHDALQSAIFALTTWWALRLLEGPQRRYDIWIGGLLLGAALLTKLSGLALAPVVGLAQLLRAWRNRDWRRLPLQALSVYAVAALVAGWWFIRNQWLYGDPLGWQMFLNIHRHMIRYDVYTWNTFTEEFLGQLGRTFWGAFGYMHITFPEVTKRLWWMSGLAGLGLIVGLLRGQRLSRSLWAEWLVALTVLLLTFASFVRFSIATVGAGHGRYLLPAGAAIGALLIAGLNGFTGWRHQRIISIGMTVGMIVYAVWLPVTLLLPKYAAPDTASAEQLANVKPANAIFADSLELIGYQIDTDIAVPGQWMRVNLYWRAVGSPNERHDPLVRLQIANDQGDVMAQDTRWPVPSLSPDVWEPNVVYVTHMVVKIPDEGLTGRLYLKVVALLRGEEGCLPAQDQSGRAYENGVVVIGDLLGVGAVVEVPAEAVPNPRQEVFASALALKGFELPADVSPGEVIPVSLYWYVLDKPAADYTVFIHVLNDRGELVTQFDRPPGGGTSPTSSWQKGQTLHDTYPLPIPPDITAGVYTVRVGMYTWPALERLPVTQEGQPVGDFVILGALIVR